MNNDLVNILSGASFVGSDGLVNLPPNSTYVQEAIDQNNKIINQAESKIDELTKQLEKIQFKTLDHNLGTVSILLRESKINELKKLEELVKTETAAHLEAQKTKETNYKLKLDQETAAFNLKQSEKINALKYLIVNIDSYIAKIN